MYTNKVLYLKVLSERNGAHNRIRTGDLFLTKEVLYRLSYVGICEYWSGKRDSNPRPSAWKADALAN